MTSEFSGPLRVVFLKDGYYVVGEGHCTAVDSQVEGERLIAELARPAAVEDGIELVFVYGTLKRGHGNWRRLLQGQSEYCGEAISYGANYRMAGLGIPFVGENANGQGHRVRGELFAVGPRVLARLDQLEGHPRVYCRSLRRFITERGQVVQAWIYLLPERDGWDFIEPNYQPVGEPPALQWPEGREQLP